MKRSLVKVLRVKDGEDRSDDGERVGDDWFLAMFGLDGDGYHYYLVTDHRHADEVPSNCDPASLSKWVADRINEEYLGEES